VEHHRTSSLYSISRRRTAENGLCKSIGYLADSLAEAWSFVNGFTGRCQTVTFPATGRRNAVPTAGKDQQKP
jgi:hypothetical protein